MDDKVKTAATEQDKRRAEHEPKPQEWPKMIYPDDKVDAEKGVVVADELAEKAQRSMWTNPDNGVAIREEENKRREAGEIKRLDGEAEAEAKAAKEADDAKRKEYEGLETTRIAQDQQMLKDAGVKNPSEVAAPQATAKSVDQIKAAQPGRPQSAKPDAGKTDKTDKSGR